MYTDKHTLLYNMDTVGIDYRVIERLSNIPMVCYYNHKINK